MSKLVRALRAGGFRGRATIGLASQPQSLLARTLASATTVLTLNLFLSSTCNVSFPV
jgi:hypothetical protein